VQDSGPSGSLVLSRKNFAFSASYRFIPAHKHRDITHWPWFPANKRRKLVRTPGYDSYAVAAPALR